MLCHSSLFYAEEKSDRLFKVLNEGSKVEFLCPDEQENVHIDNVALAIGCMTDG